MENIVSKEDEWYFHSPAPILHSINSSLHTHVYLLISHLTCVAFENKNLLLLWLHKSRFLNIWRSSKLYRIKGKTPGNIVTNIYKNTTNQYLILLDISQIIQ